MRRQQQRFCLQLSLYPVRAVNEWEEKPVAAAAAAFSPLAALAR